MRLHQTMDSLKLYLFELGYNLRLEFLRRLDTFPNFSKWVSKLKVNVRFSQKFFIKKNQRIRKRVIPITNAT